MMEWDGWDMMGLMKYDAMDGIPGMEGINIVNRMDRMDEMDEIALFSVCITVVFQFQSFLVLTVCILHMFFCKISNETNEYHHQLWRSWR